MPKKIRRPLEIVDVDEAPIDLFLGDEDGDPLASGRPIMTVMSDAATRRILGFTLDRGSSEHGGY